ncbi:hypothetical protein MRB53_041436 [Persea americana]|nr:hypothetical protein MRB53_041436 [Persea americana]
MIRASAPFDDYTLLNMGSWLFNSDGLAARMTWFLATADACILEPSIQAEFAYALDYETSIVVLRHQRMKPMLNARFSIKYAGYAWTIHEDILLTAATRCTAPRWEDLAQIPQKSAKNFRKALGMATKDNCFTSTLLLQAMTCGQPDVLLALLEHPLGSKIPIALETVEQALRSHHNVDVDAFNVLLRHYKGEMDELCLAVAQHGDAQIMSKILPSIGISAQFVSIAACRNTHHGIHTFHGIIFCELAFPHTSISRSWRRKSVSQKASKSCRPIFQRDSCTEQCYISLFKGGGQHKLVRALFDRGYVLQKVSQKLALSALEYLDNADIASELVKLSLGQISLQTSSLLWPPTQIMASQFCHISRA